MLFDGDKSIGVVKPVSRWMEFSPPAIRMPNLAAKADIVSISISPG